MQQVRLGVVSFLNTIPLIEGMETVEGVTLSPQVPSTLIDSLLAEQVDIALASSIDYQRSTEPLRILKVGVLSSDGPTRTVRLCSTRPIDQIQKVYCDLDSHTSVALLQIIMQDVYHKTIQIETSEIREYKTVDDWPDAVLMIGDKVVSSKTPTHYPYELDLGEAWKELTGLPFVFACWMGKAQLETNVVHTVAMSLDRQLKRNKHRLEQLVSTSANQRGWEKPEALSYIQETIEYEWTNRHVESVKHFFDRAYAHGLIQTLRELQFYNWG
ncbi:MAG: menaquinone biosynthesis protein [Phycisphaerales bacterium]|jgi:chorismate dehydratase|nr:menaquinone biosynthesis protein [Phycisphaerales bacterium]